MGEHSSSLFHKLPLGPNFKLHEVVSASRLYLHASSSCGSTGVHGLDVTGFAASDHEAPAHSITNNLGAKQQGKKRDLKGSRSLAVGLWKYWKRSGLLGEKKQKNAYFAIQSTSLCVRIAVPGVCVFLPEVKRHAQLTAPRLCSASERCRRRIQSVWFDPCFCTLVPVCTFQKICQSLQWKSSSGKVLLASAAPLDSLVFSGLLKEAHADTWLKAVEATHKNPAGLSAKEQNSNWTLARPGGSSLPQKLAGPLSPRY